MSAAPDLPPASTIAAWRVLLRGAGVLVALFVFCFWAAKGYHSGWTQTQVPVKQLDPITEIEFITYEDRFVPGVDYLGGGIFVGMVIFGVTFIRRRSPKSTRAAG
ncbi:MAG: hypothetical protein MUE42_03405 [Opitutaceae bacterium]|jgi:hypothetical protein|nr:hypothetical protein [Opitutaceae bacterium]